MNTQTQQSEPEIMVQTVAVSLQYNNPKRGVQQEFLMYKLGHVNTIVAAPLMVEINVQNLQSRLDDVKDAVKDLIWRAGVGQQRDQNPLTEKAYTLAQYVLPPDSGFSGMLWPGAHPQFDTWGDIASKIPWELLEERYWLCPNDHRLTSIEVRCENCGGQMKQETISEANFWVCSVNPGHRTDSPKVFCTWHGQRLTRIPKYLALDFYSTHIARGHRVGQADSEIWRPDNPRRRLRFLFIEDPKYDLCSKENDPHGVCAKHLKELHNLVEEQGFEIVLFHGSNATASHVIEAIKDEDLAGIYYFGHGYASDNESECSLVLADRDLRAGEIEQASPNVPLVFLNVCEGAGVRDKWDLENTSPSVAHAFARGNLDNVVIAPFWPVINTQASETALIFFHQALQGKFLSEALQLARQDSFKKYQDNQPHMSWFSYRYFGNPNQSLAASEEPLPKEPDPIKPATRVFDHHERFNRKVFAFGIDDVLLRAAKRRNLQNREIVTVTDFIAGLIRKGDLTQWVLYRQGMNVEQTYDLYQKIGKTDEIGSAQSAGSTSAESSLMETIEIDHEHLTEEDIQDFLLRWIVRDRREFSPELIKIFESADRIAVQNQPPEDGQRIAERNILESLITNGGWAALEHLGLPPAESIKTTLQNLAAEGIDENGWLLLNDIDPDTRKIIKTAHRLAEQRRIFPIPNRLFLAALLLEENNYSAQLCRWAGVDSKQLCSLMIAMSEETSKDEASASQSFGLGLAACNRVVLPVIRKAKDNLPANRMINEHDLFHAFCTVAADDFKNWLSRPYSDRELEAAEVDLDELKETKLNQPTILAGLTLRSKRIINQAHELAQKLGVTPIPNRLLLAAFLDSSKNYATQLLAGHNLAGKEMARKLIAAVRPDNPHSLPLSPELCDRIVTPVIRQARLSTSASNGLITEKILFRAYCAVADPNFKKSLRQVLGLDLDALANEDEPLSPAISPTSGELISTDERENEDLTSTTTAPLHSGASIEIFRLERQAFVEEVWQVLVNAAKIAFRQGWSEVRTPHLFASMIGNGTTPIALMLQQQQLDPHQVRRAVLAVAERAPQQSGFEPSTAHSKTVRLGNNALKIVRQALQSAGAENRLVNEADLGAAFFADGGGVIGELLRQVGFSSPDGPETAFNRQPTGAPHSVLAKFGINLTEKAKAGQLPIIVGRQKEHSMVLQVLQLSENANPLLIGEAGVGKTAIVEGIAQCIANGDCPARLRGLQVIELSAGALIANTRLRGEFEQRVRDVLEEAGNNVILFIDEIHTIVGAGSAEGGGPDAGNLLKTALSSGKLRLIGATTYAEYQRTIARDKALSRRFHVQQINPPSREATIQILTAQQTALEQNHQVSITKAAKMAAVDLTGRYIIDKQWPAKARDILELACVEAAAKRRRTAKRTTVTADHVAEVVARQTGIPVERVSTSDFKMLATLEERLGQRIVGQPEALQTIATMIRRGRQGLANKNRPWGSFIFIGPPGVGKTELAKALAEEVFGGLDGLIRFDMGDFTESHSVGRLIGTSPGYIGYDKGAPLVERLRRHPYSVLLFDEIEHAHENVLAVLLRLLDEGTLTDSDGNLADARNSIVIFTSNLLSSERKLFQPGFAPNDSDNSKKNTEHDLRLQMERHLSGKLVDRLDEIIRFKPLGINELTTIAGQRIDEVIKQVTRLYGVTIEIESPVSVQLATRVRDEGFNARAIRRAVDDEIANPLAALLNQLPPARKQIRIKLSNGAVQIEAV